MAQKLISKPLIEQLQANVKKQTLEFIQQFKRTPHLAVVLVGEDPASVIYTRRKGETAQQLGMSHETIRLPATATPSEVKSVCLRLNNDPKVDGILIQRPLPVGFKEDDVVYWVDPKKDVDAFHPENTGRLSLGLPCLKPCTPAGVMALLDYYKIEIRGKTACIVGRSSIVGKPMASLLLQADATVIHCHSRTADLPSFTRQADILIAAIGKPEFIGKNHVKPGAVVIDVGINRTTDGKIVGDVAFEEVFSVCSAITPVPGGIGPMTIALLLENTLRSAQARK